jgi:hypothetical protein
MESNFGLGFKSLGIVVLIISVFMDTFRLKNISNILKNRFVKHLLLLMKLGEPTEEAFKSNFGDTEVIAIHLRRGDYLKISTSSCSDT